MNISEAYKRESFSDGIAVIGGGASGICVGYYAKRSGINFKVYEATDIIGGNATTIQFKDFLFDTGAHRWHDRHPDITMELMDMIGDDLQYIHMPSHIFHNSALIDFPLSPLNLLKNLGPVTCARAGFEVLINRIFNGVSKTSLEDFAVNTYGRSLASRFLLNYSEKLWGRPCDELSPHSAGKRMKGLDLKTFIQEALYGSKAKTEHLDGSFLYPKKGIGDIVNKWIEVCGEENIIKRSKVTGIYHNDKDIISIEINGRDRVDTGYAVSTLPVSLFLNMLSPPPPEEILQISNKLMYRHLKLVALFIDKPSVTKSATVYFPDKDFIFTRLYEPKKRSVHMSPEDHTSLIIEIPCQYGSEYWDMEDEELIEKTSSKLIEIGWIKGEDIIDACVHSMHYAYPIFETGFEEKVEKIFSYLKRFRNLAFTGRNGKFEYTHLHDVMKSGKEIVEDYIKQSAKPHAAMRPV
jgi:protoporphyrinogen oxidase